ncbi:MAG: ABC transporter ATP-binding protein [Thermomicrobiales bacterium]
MATVAVSPAAGTTRQSAGAIRFDHVGKRFESFEAVRDLNLEIRDSELLVLLGPSGCGKTTTLNMLAGLEQPTSGTLYFGDRAMNNVPPEERDIAMVFQSIALYPHLNVRDNIGFALKTRGSSKEEVRGRIDDVVHILDIAQLLDRRIHQLSGGQRQRVAIAKALVRRPRLFLLDEPFSSLDAALRRQMRSELARIHREVETTMVFVTHDQEEAMAIADRIAVMNKGQIEHLGTPLEVYNHPRSLWVAQFIGSHPINVMEADRNGDSATLLGVVNWRKPLPTQFPASGQFLAGVRPEHLTLSANDDPAPGTLRAEIYTRQILGTDILYELKAGDQILRAVTPTSQVYEVGQNVTVGFDWNDAFLFDKETGAALR